jgi:threonine aldolase
MVERLAEDHRRANILAQGLNSIPGVVFEMGMPETNMVFPSLEAGVNTTPRLLSQDLAKSGIKVGIVGDRKFRLVTHAWISDDDIEKTIAAFRLSLQSPR